MKLNSFIPLVLHSRPCLKWALCEPSAIPWIPVAKTINHKRIPSTLSLINIDLIEQRWTHFEVQAEMQMRKAALQSCGHEEDHTHQCPVRMTDLLDNVFTQEEPGASSRSKMKASRVASSPAKSSASGIESDSKKNPPLRATAPNGNQERQQPSSSGKKLRSLLFKRSKSDRSLKDRVRDFLEDPQPAKNHSHAQKNAADGCTLERPEPEHAQNVSGKTMHEVSHISNGCGSSVAQADAPAHSESDSEDDDDEEEDAVASDGPWLIRGISDSKAKRVFKGRVSTNLKLFFTHYVPSFSSNFDMQEASLSFSLSFSLSMLSALSDLFLSALVRSKQR